MRFDGNSKYVEFHWLRQWQYLLLKHINCDRNTLISTGEGGEEESQDKSCSDFWTNLTHIAILTHRLLCPHLNRHACTTTSWIKQLHSTGGLQPEPTECRTTAGRAEVDSVLTSSNAWCLIIVEKRVLSPMSNF